jgi:hypothetical protein
MPRFCTRRREPPRVCGADQHPVIRRGSSLRWRVAPSADPPYGVTRMVPDASKVPAPSPCRVCGHISRALLRIGAWPPTAVGRVERRRNPPSRRAGTTAGCTRPTVWSCLFGNWACGLTADPERGAMADDTSQERIHTFARCASRDAVRFAVWRMAASRASSPIPDTLPAASYRSDLCKNRRVAAG